MQDYIIYKRAAIDAVHKEFDDCVVWDESGMTTANAVEEIIDSVPPAQPEYVPVKLEDFAKIMSENTLYSFMSWYGEALELMERYGFVICKKTI